MLRLGQREGLGRTCSQGASLVRLIELRPRCRRLSGKARPAASARFSSLLSLAVMSANSREAQVRDAYLLAGMDRGLRCDIGKSKAQERRRGGFFLQPVEPRRSIGRFRGKSWAMRSPSLSGRAPCSCSIWSSRIVTSVSAALTSRSAARSSSVARAGDGLKRLLENPHS